MTTPIQQAIYEIEKEYQEFGYPLEMSMFDLKMEIRNYAEEKGLGSIGGEK